VSAIPVMVNGELIAGKKYVARYSASLNTFTISDSDIWHINKKPKQPPVPKWMRRK